MPIRTIRLLFLFGILTGLLSCKSPLIVSGGQLPPAERSEFRAARGVKFLAVGGERVGARWIVVEPGDYAVDILSRRDLEDVSPAMVGIVEELECRVDLIARPGERLTLSSKMRRGKPKFSAGYSRFGFYTEISLDSSLENAATVLDTRRCSLSWDCSKADRTRVQPTGCS